MEEVINIVSHFINIVNCMYLFSSAQHDKYLI
mgnify:CR=1 FL=1